MGSGRWPYLLLLLTFAGCTGRTTPEPLVLGHLVPLSGPKRTAGEAARQAIEMVLPELAEEPGQAGSRPVVVLHVDSQNDAKTVRAEVVRLVTINRVSGLIGTLNADLGQTLAREAQSFGVPAVMTGEVLDLNHSDGIWQLGLSAQQRGQALARFLGEQKISRLAVVVDVQSPVADALSSALIRQVRQEKQIQIREGILNPQGDGWSGLDDLMAWQPDAIVIAAGPALFNKVCAPSGLVVDAKGQNRWGAKVPIVYGGEDVGPLPSAGEEITRIVATVVCPEGLTAAGQAFLKSYTKKFGQDPPLFSTVQTVDALRFLVESVHPGKNQSAFQPKERILIPDPFQSFTGKITFRAQQTQRPLFLLEQKGANIRLLKTLEGGVFDP